MNRTRDVRAVFILSIAVACSLRLWPQQADSSGDQAMPSQLSALLARANANTATGRKSSSASQKAPSGASNSGGTSNWGTSKSSFGSPSQPGGIWRDGTEMAAPPATAAATTPTVSLPSGLSLRSSTPPSGLSIAKPAGFTPPNGFKAPSGLTSPTGLKQPVGFTQPSGSTPPPGANSMAGRSPSSSVKHGSALGSFPSRTVGQGRSGGLRSRSALAGRGALAKASGSRGGAPAFHARPLPSRVGAAGAKKPAQAGAGRTNQRGHAVGSGLNRPRGMEPASPVAHEIGTLPKTNSPDTQP